MSSELQVLVIVPTYQEATNIDNVLGQIREAAPAANVLVVDDNSPDGTADLAEKCAEKWGRIEVLKRPGKAGLGSAYREGFARAISEGYDVVIEMDADLSHDPKDLPRLIDGIAGGADLVVGSRYVPGGAIPGWPAHRALLSRWGNIYAARALGTPLKDATSGYRAYRITVLGQVPLQTVRADGYGFQIEMAYLMHRAGAVIREIPITFVDRTEGTSKMSSRIIVEALFLVTAWGFRDRVMKPVLKRRSDAKR